VSPTATESSTKREIEVEIPAEEVARETQNLIQKYQKLARIPGFRKGHAPASIIRQRFAEDLKSDVVEALVPRYFRKEAEKLGVVPVSQPRVTDLHIHDGEPLRFKASFEVMPTIRLENYKDLKAEKPEIVVTDEEVQESLNNLRERQATFTSIEGRPAADGDFAQVSLDGVPKDGDAESKPVHMDEVLVEIGGKNTMPEFTEHLRGASAGDERTFDVTYAADAQEQRLAGKTFTYTVKVQALKEKHLPELNDDFAKELGEFANLDEVKKRIRDGMEAERKHAAEHEGKDKLMAELVKRNEFEVPEALVEHQVDVRLERGLRALQSQGMKAEDIKKMDFARLRAGQREQAVQEVKASLLLDRIAEEEKIEVSDAEIDHEIEALALQSKQSTESIRARLTEDGALDRIRNRIRNEKTLDFLYRQSA
jgi:trigger factor